MKLIFFLNGQHHKNIISVLLENVKLNNINFHYIICNKWGILCLFQASKLYYHIVITNIFIANHFLLINTSRHMSSTFYNTVLLNRKSFVSLR